MPQEVVTAVSSSVKRPHDDSYNTSSKRPRNLYTNPPSVPASGSNVIQSSSSVPRTGWRTPCPPLTPAEQKLLNEFKGCRKCRKFFTGHRAENCDDDFPDGRTYKTLTREMGLEAATRKAIAATYESRSETRPSPSFASAPASSSASASFAGAVSAVMPSYTNSSSLCQSYMFDPPMDIFNHTTTPVLMPNVSAGIPLTSDAGPIVNPVAASLPSSTMPFALSPDSGDSDAEPLVSPVSVPHLVWRANLFGRNEFPVPVDCLLDNGSHLVLIRPETVANMGLPIRKLKEPIHILLALGGENRVTRLTDFVSLSLSSLNNAWSSRPVSAIIAPGLCANILLGLPFLEHNHIVIDHSLRSAIHKPSGFNLVDETTIRKPTTPPSVHVKIRRRQRIEDNVVRRDAFLQELKWKCQSIRRKLAQRGGFVYTQSVNVITQIKDRIETIATAQKLADLDSQLKTEFKPCFSPIPHVNELPLTETARIEMKKAENLLTNRTYTCPRQMHEAFQKILQLRLDSGFIRPSSSQFASPSFIIPKADPKALPRWVCNYRWLNGLSISDAFPLPRIDDILADCAKGKIWGKIDMTDSFFQTRMHPDDIHKTAVTTPFGLYEWTVMPMGFKNSPAIHQCRVTNALRPLIGKICHVYIDDIVIWSNTLEEHVENVRSVMQALLNAKLYVNEKKTQLFCHEIKFLGHRISCAGIEADNSKVAKILEWPVPTSATETRQFLGLVRYLSAFLPKLAVHTGILNRLTGKEAERDFPPWTQAYQNAFDAIKSIVVSRECLTVIDHSKLDENKIFITTDASDKVTGAVLSFGPTWETARPVAFDSETLKGAELNYPVHEKELLAIVRALKKWKVDLLGSPVFVYTDHKTLLNFHTQRDLSRRQARWMEELSIYETKFVYVKGEDNSVADALSRFPFTNTLWSVTAESTASHPYLSPPYLAPEVKLLNVSQNSPFSCIASLMEAPICVTEPVQANKFKVEVDDDEVLATRWTRNRYARGNAF